MPEKPIAQIFNQIVENRRSVRIYDQDVPFDSEAVRRSLERAVLSANSSNMQLWEFYWVQSADVKHKLEKACMGQSAAKTANELVVFVTRQDKWEPMAKWNLENMERQFAGKELTKRDLRALDYYKKLMPLLYRDDFFGFNTLLRKLIILFMGFNKPFMRISTKGDQRVMLHKSSALAAQIFMLSMTAEGYDTCPMEGFDKNMVSKALNLPATAEITMIVACGKGKPEGIYSERLRVPNEEVIFEV